jgi:integrase
LGNARGAIVRLVILTGQRREEIGGLRWSEIDVSKGLIALPGERTKNHRPQDVPLTDTAAAVIAGCRRRQDRDLIFGEGIGAYQGWSKSKAALDKSIAKKAGENGRVGPWRLHDIRRTVSMRMSDLGVLPHVVEAVLNHVSGHKAGVAGTYNRSVYGPEKRAALELWTKHVLTLVGDAPDAGQVVMFPARASG